MRRMVKVLTRRYGADRDVSSRLQTIRCPTTAGQVPSPQWFGWVNEEYRQGRWTKRVDLELLGRMSVLEWNTLTRS